MSTASLQQDREVDFSDLTVAGQAPTAADAADRGQLEVAERVVVAIARAAAMEVPGVATPSQNKSASKAAGGVSGITSQIGDQL
ncbi:hypothetical protein ACUN7V_05385, partial [Quadrisphaera oryzae]